MNENLDYPFINESLIKTLMRDFPDVLPENELTYFEIGRLVGRQDVIKKLRAEFNKQQEDM